MDSGLSMDCWHATFQESPLPVPYTVPAGTASHDCVMESLIYQWQGESSKAKCE